MKLFSVMQMKLRSRMLLLVGAVLGGFVFATFMGLYMVQEVKVGSSIYRTIRKNLDLIERAAFLSSQFNQVRADIINLIFETDTSKVPAMREEVLATVAAVDKGFADLLGSFPAGRRASIEEAQGTWSAFSATLQREMLPAIERTERLQAWQIASGVQKERYDSFRSQVDGVVQALKHDNALLESEVATLARNKILTTILLEIVLFTGILVLVHRITRSLTTPVLDGVAFARSVAGGDLTRTLDASGRDEIGDLARGLNAMVGSLNQLVGRVSRSAAELARVSREMYEVSARVDGAARQQATGIDETSSAIMEINGSIQGVAQSVENLSFSATESSSSILQMAASVEEVALNVQALALSVEEVSSSIMEMTSSIRHIDENVAALMQVSGATASSVAEMDSSIKEVENHAKEAAAITMEVYREAEAGKTSVEAAIAGMMEIRRSSGITAEVISTLSRRADDIGMILSVIDEVAEQTSLLALNAAIIAAQAGEHGKGFAVVADEIKDLAERTSVSTREISRMIGGVQEETRRAVQAITAAEKSIAEGESLSQRSGAALDKILSRAENATDRTQEIARSTVEQAHGSRIIRQAMEQVADMVEQIAR
ncbi:MAG TPA: methyl-accepting chemotaxis protein, partial [Verrucomicrobiae bacterium]|nr:methyl-accepting chemotaxis protein [Verrucomicrobiae bacterium]